MAYDFMAAVREWHEAVGERLVELDERGRRRLYSLRAKLIWEETVEVSDELLALMGEDPDADIAHVAKELADLLYVVFGTADLLAIPIDKVFDLVHRNNLSKVDPETGTVLRRGDGKVVKPENYRPIDPEDVRDILAAA